MPSPVIRRGLWAVGIATVAIAVAYAALPYVASTRIVRDRIAWEMSAWSGFRVSIEGAPQIRIWPKFGAVLTDVTLSKWTEADGAPVIEAERVEVDLSAMAALRGDVVFSAARMIRPTLRLEPAANGMLLPAMPSGGRITRSIEAARGLVKADPSDPDMSKLPGDSFGIVEFRDGRMVTDAQGKEEELLTSLNGQARWTSLNSSASLSATAIWRGESVAIDLASAKPMVLFAGGAAPLTVSFKAAPAAFSFDGTASLSENAYLDGEAKFSAPSFRRMLEWSRIGIAPGAAIGSVSVSSRVTAGAGRAKFDNTELVLDKNPGMGAIDLSYAEALPIVSGTLAFDTLDLRAFLSAFTPLAGGSDDVAGQSGGFADQINLDLRLSAARASVGAIQLADVAATAQVKDGLSVFDISDASAFGGNVQASLRLDRKPDGTQAELRLLASDIDGGAFGTAAGMKRLVPVGTGNVSVILKGPGKAWDSILDNADGSFSATFGPGALTGLDLPAFLKRSEQGGFFALDDIAEGTMPIDGAELKASISKGVARIEKAEANSTSYKLWLSGIVPFAGRGLALSGGVVQPNAAPAPAPADGQVVLPQTTGANEASFFVGGTWDKPFISPVNRQISGE